MEIYTTCFECGHMYFDDVKHASEIKIGGGDPTNYYKCAKCKQVHHAIDFVLQDDNRLMKTVPDKD